MLYRIFILSIICLLIIASHSAAAKQKRIALVIGNSNYTLVGALKNPKNDAIDIASALKQNGFEVIKLLDAPKRTMDNTIRKFTRRLNEPNTIGLFYYAGHGVQIKNRNYLLPLQADIKEEADVEYNAVSVGWVLDLMDEAENDFNLVVLDACRDNPYGSSFRSVKTGLAKADNLPKGSMILYAASPGQQAEDGEGRNGLFTSKLLQSMKTPGLTVDEMINQTAREVYKTAKAGQLPYKEGIILNNFYFNASKVKAPTNTVSTKSSSPIKFDYEKKFWESVDLLGSRELYGAYIDEYPKGRYIALAHKKLQMSKKDTSLTRSNNEGEKNKTNTLKPRIPIPKKELLMVRVKGDCFNMGSNKLDIAHNDNEREHFVCIDDFMMSKHEITFSQYDTFAIETKRKLPSDSGFGRGNHPVINVTWQDAYEYTQWLSIKTGKKYRLPTEAEWEFAARGGTATPYYTGDCIDSKSANFDGNHPGIGCSKSDKYNKTLPVCSLSENSYGLCDITGNVWEWICSSYDKIYGGSELECIEPGSNHTRIQRGGSWNSEGVRLRAAYRDPVPVDFSNNTLGFRVVQQIK